MRKSGTQKSWITSLERTLNLHRPVLGQVELRSTLTGLAARARGRVLEGPRELLAGDVDDHRVRAWRFSMSVQDDVGVGAQADEQHRRDRGPDDLERGVAVDRRAVLELLAGPHAELPRRRRGRRPRPARRPAPRRPAGRRTASSMSSACVEACAGEPVDRQRRWRCRSTDATTPTTSICAERVPRLRPVPLSGAHATAAILGRRRRRDDASMAARAGSRRRAAGGGGSGGAGGERGAACAAAAARAVAARRGSPRARRRVAAEGLGELRRLAVADPRATSRTRQAAGGEQLGGAVHAHRGQVLAERRVADLGVRALELAARGRDAAGDVVEREVGARTRPRRSRRRPRTGSCAGVTVAGRCIGTSVLRAGWRRRDDRPERSGPSWRVAARERRPARVIAALRPRPALDKVAR